MMSRPARPMRWASDPLMPPAIGWDLAAAPWGRSAGTGWQGQPFSADVDLLAPVQPARGTLPTGPRVAAEMRREHHLDPKLITFWKRKNRLVATMLLVST